MKTGEREGSVNLTDVWFASKQPMPTSHSFSDAWTSLENYTVRVRGVGSDLPGSEALN